jgi:hypothetical protein
MRAIEIATAVLALVELLPVRSGFAQTTAPGVQLEAGIAKEEVDGDLKSAIEVYLLFRIGPCREQFRIQNSVLTTMLNLRLADAPAHHFLRGLAFHVYRRCAR